VVPLTAEAQETGFAIGGEQLDTTDPDDARHWVQVYTELLNGVQGIGVSDDGVKERWVERLSSRLELWKTRLAELKTGDSPTP
jgi:hypothetical protein